MANLLFIFSYLPLLLNHFHFLAQGLALPVTKDPSTLQYITRVHLGTNNPINLVLDLGGPFLWATGRCSSSGDPISGTSLHCAKAKAHQPSGTRTPICHLPTLNTITGAEAGGQLVEDELTLGSKVNGFLFSCAPAFLLAGLAGGSGGMLGLGRGSGIGPLSQVVSGGQRKFFTCFSSSTGVLLLGDLEVNALQASGIISKSTLYTPLVPGPSASSSHDYFINVKSIKVNGERIPVEGNIGIAKISSVVTYTTLSSSVYGAFVKAYELAAASMNMTRVASVSPFGLCFSSQAGGPLVIPAVDFVLQSEMVKWRVNGRNTMVEAGGGGVVCLGFLDGGSAMDSEVVVGGLQLEDNLLEFDLGTNMFGFGNFLSENRAFSCSDFVSRPSLLVNE